MALSPSEISGLKDVQTRNEEPQGPTAPLKKISLGRLFKRFMRRHLPFSWPDMPDLDELVVLPIARLNLDADFKTPLELPKPQSIIEPKYLRVISKGRVHLEEHNINLMEPDTLYVFRESVVQGGSSIAISKQMAVWGQSEFIENAEALYPNDSLLITHSERKLVCRAGPMGESPARYVGRAVSLLDSSSGSFGHFVLGLVPKLRIFFNSDAKPPNLALVDSAVPRHLVDLIRNLVPALELLTVERGQQVFVEQLLIPKPLKFFPDHVQPHLGHHFNLRAFHLAEFEFLFRHESATSRSQRSSRVFLFRDGSGESLRRRILGMSRIRDTLEAHGFVDVSPQIIDPMGLAQSLREADVIVTDDGSISFNLLLAGISGKRVVFLGGPDFGGAQSWGMPGYLALFGNSVLVVMGKSVFLDNQFSDWRVCLQDLKIALDLAES